MPDTGPTAEADMSSAGTIEREPGRPRQTELLARLRGSRIVGQAALYTLASGLGMGLSGVAKAIFAREMHPSAYGSVAFAIAFLTFLSGVFDFGLYSSAARRLARSEVAARRELLGACVASFAPLALMAFAATFGLSFVVDHAFHVHAAGALRICSLFAFAWSFAGLGEVLAKGTDRLYVYSVSNMLGSVALLVAIGVLLIAGVSFTTTVALAAATFSMVFSLALFIFWLRPMFRRVRAHVRDFIADSRAWAFQVYIGRLSSIGTYNMDVLMVAWFSNAKSTGYYSLAGALAGVTGLPMLGLAASLYPRMAREKAIERHWIAAAWGVGALSLVATLVLARPLVTLVFGKDYRPVATLAIPLVMAMGVRGVINLYNTFMSAHARGREMRNRAFIFTGSNIVFNFALIPPFGATGAAWASLAAMLVNYIAYVTYYRRYVAGNPQTDT